MNIRLSTPADLDALLDIYAAARATMKRTGNPTQWGDHWPPVDVIAEDIASGIGYLVEQDGRPCAAFALIHGDDPTYQEIADGQWRNDAPYATIHRLAADGTAHGVFADCVQFCKQQADNLRADTHPDNHIMQHLLEKFGFVRCGLIATHDGTPRIAYQWTK